MAYSPSSYCLFKHRHLVSTNLRALQVVPQRRARRPSKLPTTRSQGMKVCISHLQTFRQSHRRLPKTSCTLMDTGIDILPISPQRDTPCALETIQPSIGGVVRFCQFVLNEDLRRWFSRSSTSTPAGGHVPAIMVALLTNIDFDVDADISCQACFLVPDILTLNPRSPR